MIKGPSQVNLDKAVSNIIKTKIRNKMHNTYWNSVFKTDITVMESHSTNPVNYENILKSYKVKDIKKLPGKWLRKQMLWI